MVNSEHLMKEKWDKIIMASQDKNPQLIVNKANAHNLKLNISCKCKRGKREKEEMSTQIQLSAKRSNQKRSGEALRQQSLSLVLECI